MAEDEKTDKAATTAETGGEGAKSSHRKVSLMTLAQVEASLEAVKKQMGGYYSKYAQRLLERKNTLTGASK